MPFTSLTPADQCYFDLHVNLPEKGQRRVTIDEVMAVNVKPGWLLCPKMTTEVHGFPSYKMKRIDTEKLQKAALQRVGKAFMVSTVFRLSTKTSHHTYIELMALMWYQLNNRQSIEVQLQYNKKEYYVQKKRHGGDPFDRVFDKALHLRPDVMLKAMPENCGIIIDPQTNNEGLICWAIGPPYANKNGKKYPPKNATNKLYEKREVVVKRMELLQEEAFKEVSGFIEGSDDLISPHFLSGSPETSRAFHLAIKEKKRQREQVKEALLERAELRGTFVHEKEKRRRKS